MQGLKGFNVAGLICLEFGLTFKGLGGTFLFFFFGGGVRFWRLI